MKKTRKIESGIFYILMIIATTIIVSSLLLILWTIVEKGIHSLTWDMVSKVPEGGFYFGKEGGVLNAIIGSLYITLGSGLLGLLISMPIVLYVNIYAKRDTFFTHAIRLILDVLFGIPSIVYGAFGFTIMVYFGLKTSLLAGIITVGFLTFPIMARSMDEVVKLTPTEMEDSLYSLGATKWEACKVLLKYSIPGILTALLLSLGRAIGDAASVLFTAGFTDSIPTSLGQPTATLPLSIFFQLSSPIPEVQNRAYAAALILTIIVLIISLSAKFIQQRLLKH